MRHLFIASALTATALASAVSAQAATYNIEPTHTFVTFEVMHFGTSTNPVSYTHLRAHET